MSTRALSTWTSLREHLTVEHALLEGKDDRLLLACNLPLGRWLVRVKRAQRRGVPALEVSVLIGRAGELPLSLAAVNDNLVAGRLTLSNDYLVLHDVLPFDGLQLGAVRQLIDQLAGEAGRILAQMRPQHFVATVFNHFAE